MDVIWLIFLFATGACIGSFLNVVIYRLPRGLSIVFPGSHCPACGRAIHWYDNIPLLSWLLLKARCRFCKTHISPRYFVVELVTALLVASLYVCYYMLRVRTGAGMFINTWPMFTAIASLLCGLLVCTVVDITDWIIPLEVCWFVSLVGLIGAAAGPRSYPFMQRVSAPLGAAGVGAAVGLLVAIVLQKRGVIQPSFIDADDRPTLAEPEPESPDASDRIIGAAATTAHGVNPRREMGHELLFLTPPVLLAVAAWCVVTCIPAVRTVWYNVASPDSAAPWAPHVTGLLAALFGYLVGGLLIWVTRIVGTLVFGKEAMGLGDVHILAAVGAVTGWLVPAMVFFIAPFFALAWVLLTLVGRRQRELPYGPWLAVATLAVLLAYDPLHRVLSIYLSAIGASR